MKLQKINNTIIVSILIITLLILTVTPVFAQESKVTNGESIAMEKQSESIDSYHKILDEYNESSDLLDPEIDYPDYYAGAYIDNHQELVVLLTKNEDSDIVGVDPEDRIADITDDSDIETKTVTYSYNQLLDIYNGICHYIEKKPDSQLAKIIKDFGIYDDKNCVIVGLSDTSNKNLDLFKKEISDSNAVKFEKFTTDAVAATDILPGSQIIASDHGYSMGFRCKKNGKVGFVTAAHKNKTGATVSIGNTNIGKITARKQSGSVDAAFVEITNSKYSPSNKLGSLSTLEPTCYLTPIGTKVVKMGYVGGVTSGKVLANHYTATIDSITFTELIKASCTCKQGDSGGIVYCDNLSNPNNKAIVGIVTAQCYNSKDGNFTAITAAKNICTSLGVTPY